MRFSVRGPFPASREPRPQGTGGAANLDTELRRLSAFCVGIFLGKV